MSLILNLSQGAWRVHPSGRQDAGVTPWHVSKYPRRSRVLEPDIDFLPGSGLTFTSVYAEL